MSRFGCVTPSEGLDVTDRKACFLSLLAQAPVWLFKLRVSQHFSTFYGSSVQAMNTQLDALPILPVLARGVSGCVNSAFLDILRLICSVHGYPTQRTANTTRPRSYRLWLLELRVSRHFSTFYGPSVQSMDTQLGAGIDGGPRRFTEVVLNEQPLPVAWWSHHGRKWWHGNSGQWSVNLEGVTSDEGIVGSDRWPVKLKGGR